MKAHLQKLSWGHGIALWLLGGAFFAFGLWFFVGILTDVFYGYWRTRARVTAEARLRSVEFKKSPGSSRAPSPASIVVSYDYQVSGESFSGSRIALFKQNGDFSERLSGAFRSGTPISVFIDPDYPQFAVIDRDFALLPCIVAVPLSLAFLVGGASILWGLFRTPNCQRLVTIYR